VVKLPYVEDEGIVGFERILAHFSEVAQIDPLAHKHLQEIRRTGNQYANPAQGRGVHQIAQAMLASSTCLNLNTEQTPGVLVEVSDCLKRSLVCVFDILVVLFDQVFNEGARPVKKIIVRRLVSSFRCERANSEINSGTIYTSPLPSKRIPLHFNFLPAVDPF
jgi:hypothetical protein